MAPVSFTSLLVRDALPITYYILHITYCILHRGLTTPSGALPERPLLHPQIEETIYSGLSIDGPPHQNTKLPKFVLGAGRAFLGTSVSGCALHHANNTYPYPPRNARPNAMSKLSPASVVNHTIWDPKSINHLHRSAKCFTNTQKHQKQKRMQAIPWESHMCIFVY